MVNIYCDMCRRVTPHMEMTPKAAKANPTTAQGLVDLTGRENKENGWNTVSMSPEFMSEVKEYKCTKCGNRTMNAGVNPTAPDDAFGGLMRGDDWKPPPEPKEQ